MLTQKSFMLEMCSTGLQHLETVRCIISTLILTQFSSCLVDSDNIGVVLGVVRTTW